VLKFKSATSLWEPSHETSFYLSNRPIGATQAMRAVRHHWGIESNSHHVRDVTLHEDASRIRTKPAIFARFRSFAANVLRFNQKKSIRQDRYANALGGPRDAPRVALRIGELNSPDKETPRASVRNYPGMNYARFPPAKIRGSCPCTPRTRGNNLGVRIT